MTLSVNQLNARRFLINVDEMSLSFLWTSREFESLEPSGDERSGAETSANEVSTLLCLGGVYEVTAETPTWRQHQPLHLVIADASVTLPYIVLPTVRPKSTSSCPVTSESHERSSSSTFSFSPTFCYQINQHLDCRARILEDLHEPMLHKVF